MATELVDIDNLISLGEYFSAHGVNHSDEERVFVIALMLLLHQSKNASTLCEVRGNGVDPLYGCDWLNRFTPLLAMDASVLQELWDAIKNSGNDLQGHFHDALRLTFEEWAEASDCDTSNLTDIAITRGISRVQRVGARLNLTSSAR